MFSTTKVDAADTLRILHYVEIYIFKVAAVNH